MKLETQMESVCMSVTEEEMTQDTLHNPSSKLMSLTTIYFNSANVISYMMLTKIMGYFNMDVTLGVVKVEFNRIQADLSEMTLNVTATKFNFQLIITSQKLALLLTD